METVDDRTDISKVVDQAMAAIGNRSLFIVISDLLVPVDRIQAAIARIRHRRHDLMLLQVLDRQELRFDLDDPAPFEGLEGEGRLNVDPRVVREDYLDAIEAHCGAIERTARSHGYDYLRLDSHASVGPAIAAMLGRRRIMARGGGGA